MKLTKVNVTEGIKLSEVTGNESIYEWCNGSLIYRHSKDRCDFMPNCYYCIIRDNKVIPIIKDEEYDNKKPYLIGKDENHITGYIYYYSKGFGMFLRDLTNWNDSLNRLISIVNKEGYNIYKQE